MRRCVQRLSPVGAVLLGCSLLLLGASPRAAHAQGTEICDFVATAPGVSLASLPATRTFTIVSATCTLTPPSTIGKMFCGESEMAVTPLGGSWQVTFLGQSGGVVDYTTDDLSSMTMSSFTLCGFTHNVQSHTMTSQSFTYDDNTGLLSGASTDRIISLVGNWVTARADKTGTYSGTISNFSGPTMTATFTYNGTWVAKGFLGALSPLSMGVLAALLVGAGGSLLWRRRARST